MATGAELGIAVDAADALAKEGVRAAVVSMPSMELFRAQDASYRAQVLGIAPRVAIEAGVAQCWYEWLGENGRFVGLSDFGASAPAPQLFEHFGLTAKHVTQTVHGLLEK
jgi:transketolase